MKPIWLAGALALALSGMPARAGEISVTDAYARSANPRSGAVFMVIRNSGTAERLVGARTEVARRAELHDHVSENGIMRMVAIEGGIEIPADGVVELKRGGRHVMLMGLVAPLADGDRFPLTLLFADGREITVEVPVDNHRDAGGRMHERGEQHGG
ncbi:MAG: hypothetical protein KatS3mg118_3703 [Paracoccaceae bacterium]|nr:MAG: hypothetical protein KatS3mg118_3703 [Paracoccaceae bacterium]